MICLLTYVQKECTYYLFNNGELVSQYVKEDDICATTTAMYKWPTNLQNEWESLVHNINQMPHTIEKLQIALSIVHL
jgi:hypothetical protein